MPERQAPDVRRGSEMSAVTDTSQIGEEGMHALMLSQQVAVLERQFVVLYLTTWVITGRRGTPSIKLIALETYVCKTLAATSAISHG